MTFASKEPGQSDASYRYICAATVGDLSNMNIAIQEGAEPTTLLNGKNAIHFIMDNANHRLLVPALKHGCSIDAIDNNDWSVWEYTTSWTDKATVIEGMDFLVACGFPVKENHDQTKWDQETSPQDRLAAAIRLDDEDVFRYAIFSEKTTLDDVRYCSGLLKNSNISMKDMFSSFCQSILANQAVNDVLLELTNKPKP